MNVPEELEKLGDLYKQRNAQYGDCYKHHGEIMEILFPGGWELNTKHDFNKFMLFNMLLIKLMRFSQTMSHDDSLDDMAVYAQMLKEICHDKRMQDKVRIEKVNEG